MTSLLREFAAKGDDQADIKSADGNDAGKNDITSKKVDVGFSLMRNMINKDGQVSGSDVNDYLERAHDLNDEVETVGFAVEDDGGEIIKIYVNAAEADAFEEEMAKLLGLEDDVEAAINELAQKFDIIDVVWPEDPLDGSENDDSQDPDADLSIDSSAAEFEMDPEGGEEPAPVVEPETAEGDLDADALPADDDTDETPAPKKDKGSLMKDVASKAADAVASDDTSTDDEGSTPPNDDPDAVPAEEPVDGETPPADPADPDAPADEEPAEDEMEPVLNDDGSQKLDKDGNPVMRKKRAPKKDAADEEPVVEEGVRDELEAHIRRQLSKGVKGQFYIETLVTGGHQGRKKHPVTRGGEVVYFKEEEQATQEAERLRRIRNSAGATASYKYEVKMVEHMNEFDTWKTAGASTFGSTFLQRLEEAETESDIPLDSQAKALRARMKRPIEKQIVELFVLCGIIGRLIKGDGVEDAIRGGGDKLRKNASAKRAFMEFYAALKSAKGYGAKAVDEELLAEAGKVKRGSPLQKKLETVLIALGLPDSLVASGTSTGGYSAPAMFKTAKLIDGDSALTSSLNRLALKLGIKPADVNAKVDDDTASMKPGDKNKGLKDAEEVTEDVNVGNDPYFEAVVSLCMALGIPEKNLQYQRSQLMQSLRAKKQLLNARGMILQKMAGLGQLIAKNTRKQAEAQAPAKPGQVPAVEEGLKLLKAMTINEAFGDLEALVKSDMEMYGVIEPDSGPAMAASYEGSGKHEDTKLILGVDPEDEILYVEVTSPWDGTVHKKKFTNDKAGYKAAIDYANVLRTWNAKSGGRPKGWKDAAPVVDAVVEV